MAFSGRVARNLFAALLFCASPSIALNSGEDISNKVKEQFKQSETAPKAAAEEAEAPAQEEQPKRLGLFDKNRATAKPSAEEEQPMTWVEQPLGFFERLFSSNTHPMSELEHTAAQEEQTTRPGLFDRVRSKAVATPPEPRQNSLMQRLTSAVGSVVSMGGGSGANDNLDASSVATPATGGIMSRMSARATPPAGGADLAAMKALGEEVGGDDAPKQAVSLLQLGASRRSSGDAKENMICDLKGCRPKARKHDEL